MIDYYIIIYKLYLKKNINNLKLPTYLIITPPDQIYSTAYYLANNPDKGLPLRLRKKNNAIYSTVG